MIHARAGRGWAWLGRRSGVLAAVWWHSGGTTVAAAAAVVAAVAAVTGPRSSFLTTSADPQSTIDDRLERLATVVRVQ